MTKMSRWRLVAVAVLGTAAMASPGATVRAKADCVYVDAYVERENDSTVYPLGPDPCRLPTSAEWMVFVPVDVGHDVPEGAPKRVFVDVRIPVP